MTSEVIGGTSAIGVDFNWLENNTYISTNGTAVEDTLETALIHELVHLTTGLEDTNNPGEKGDTVVLANTIYAEMGLAEQASYLAYDTTSNTHVTNFEYTHGQAIDRAFTLWSENPNANDFDSSVGGDLDDLIIGNERDNSLTSGEGDDFLYGGAGNDTLRGDQGDDELIGGDGSDDLRDYYGDNKLTGGAGNDFLSAGEGSDVLNGGTGDDEISGGGGENLFIYSYGDGNDKYFGSGSGIDTIKFTDIASTEVILRKRNGSLIFSFVGNTDQISFKDQFYTADQMEFFEFSDGVTWNVNDINTQLSTATNGDDFLYGNSDDNELVALDGNDELYGEDGNDVLNGGAGNDLLSGDYGDDVYIFDAGSGSDEIIDVDGQDSIQFGAGITASDLHIIYSPREIVINLVSSNAQADDQILIKKTYANNTIEKLVFSNGDTVLWNPTAQTYDSEDINSEITLHEYDNVIYDPGYGETWLIGTDGNDLFIGRSGYHVYTISSNSGHDVIEDTSNLSPYAEEDARGTLFLRGVTDEQISAVRDVDDLVINIGDGVTQSIRIVDQYIGLGINTIRVENSSLDDPQELVFYHLIPLHDTPGYWDNGEKHIYDMSFDDLFGPRVFGPRIQGTYSSDAIIGSDGDDIITGGKGDDLLWGGKGDDTYNYNVGDGSDTITDNKGSNRVKFGEAITTGNITVIAAGDGFTVYVPGGAKIDVQGGNLDDINVFNFRFSDGTTWNSSDIWANTTVVGTNDNDTMDYKSLISGTSFDMGLGDDIIYGGQGGDNYLFNLGDGQDTLSDNKGIDNIVFGERVVAENLRITHDDTESNWIIELLDNNGQLTGDKITVENAYSDTSYQFETFEFSDGTFMELAEIQLAAETLYTELVPEPKNVIDGTVADDTLNGTIDNDVINGLEGHDELNGLAGNDTLNGGDGHDILNGGSGDDILRGGVGWDALNGGDGSDTYLFGLGDHGDVITDNAADVDVLEFTDISSMDVIFQRDSLSTDDLLITFSNSSDNIIVNAQFSYDVTNTIIESFIFSDGITLTAADVLAQVDGVISTIDGTEAEDSLLGGADDNVINGLGADDYLAGLGGNDTLNGGAGDDLLEGGEGNDLLNAGIGHDILNGGSGDDILRGGVGWDALNGGDGSDTYLFGVGDQGDTISNYDTGVDDIDVLVVDNNLALEDLWFSQASNNLQINIVGTDDHITVTDWYSGNDYQLDEIHVGSLVLLNNQLQQLVTAMSAYDVPEGEGSSISPEALSSLNPVWSEVWTTS